jgi:hypothetical protein
VCVCARARACVRTCVRACMCACVRACACARAGAGLLEPVRDAGPEGGHGRLRREAQARLHRRVTRPGPIPARPVPIPARWPRPDPVCSRPAQAAPPRVGGRLGPARPPRRCVQPSRLGGKTTRPARPRPARPEPVRAGAEWPGPGRPGRLEAVDPARPGCGCPPAGRRAETDKDVLLLPRLGGGPGRLGMGDSSSESVESASKLPCQWPVAATTARSRARSGLPCQRPPPDPSDSDGRFGRTPHGHLPLPARRRPARETAGARRLREPGGGGPSRRQAQPARACRICGP